MAKIKYDIIYSIGSNCACALYLNQNDLRLTSGPFDWITGVDFNTKINFILEEFKGFCDKNNLEYIVYNENPTYNQYKDIQNGCLFLHDFPKDSSFELSYPQVKDKYNRRIKRFYDNLSQKNKVLLVWFSLDRKVTDDDIIKASAALNKKFNKEIDLLIIEHNDSMINQKPLKRQINNNITKYELFAKKEENISGFTRGNTKLCNQIFKKYAINRPLGEIYKRFCYKLICNLIPLKKARKRLRNYLLYEKS